jgi:hypothetical protein
MSLSLSLLFLGIERKVIQPEVKGGKLTQFPQFCECRDVSELLVVITRNRKEGDTA